MRLCKGQGRRNSLWHLLLNHRDTGAAYTVRAVRARLAEAGQLVEVKSEMYQIAKSS